MQVNTVYVLLLPAANSLSINCAFILILPDFPEDHMYLVLNRFLLSHQSLDFRRVPEFFKLFYGFDLEVKDYTIIIIMLNRQTFILFSSTASDYE